MVGTAENVVVVIGTPVDEHLNPNQTAIPKALGGCSPYLRDGQLLVLRSTVFPGVTALVEKMIAGLGVAIEVAFCPERIAEGKAMTELFELPQIVSARSPQGMDRAVKLFSLLTESASSSCRRKRPSSPSCSPTSGATSSSPPPTSST